MQRPLEQKMISNRALLWLALATFAMGIDGYVLTGLLPQIASDLDVDVAAAGQLLSMFALTSAVAGPLLGAATGGWERKGTISASLIVFVLGNLLVAVADTYFWAMTGRVVSAVGAALLTAVVSSYVVAKTPPERRGRALSLVLGGWLAATALGVPFGLLIGQDDWRLPLFLVSAVGAVAWIGILIWVPRLRLPAQTLAVTLSPLRQPRVIGGILVASGIMCASYICFTYAALIIGPRIDAGIGMVAALFGYGVVSLVGNVVAGRIIDRAAPVRVLTVILVVLIAVAILGALGLLLPGIAGGVAAIVWFLACAFFNGGTGVSLQTRLTAMAPESATLVLALNASGCSLGTALGGILGGAFLAVGFGADTLLPVSAVILVATLALHLLVARSERRGVVLAA